MLEKVIKILSEQLEISESEINGDSNLQEDLDADSLDVMEIVMELEEEFDIEIDDEDVTKITTPNQIVKYIEQKLEA